MKLGKIVAVYMVLMIFMGSFTCVFAEERALEPYFNHIIRVELDDSEFNGSKVELLKKDGTFVNSWNLKEKGELVADLPPGSYTLREIIEINGYEIPRMSNIMVGCGKIIPYDPEPDTIEPSFDPLDYLPTDPLEPSFPSYYYDKFQQWIDNQN